MVKLKCGSWVMNSASILSSDKAADEFIMWLIITQMITLFLWGYSKWKSDALLFNLKFYISFCIQRPLSIIAHFPSHVALLSQSRSDHFTLNEVLEALWRNMVFTIWPWTEELEELLQAFNYDNTITELTGNILGPPSKYNSSAVLVCR